MAYRASIDPEGPGVDVGGLSALRVHQEQSARKIADHHALSRLHVAAEVHAHPALPSASLRAQSF